eukprot:CAMPEP_0206478884 /NCGR_PEP_ID=MMETSP0324_2-20121206/36353_1 /ASSEMBLY_ACC=CAM_ASM_000836 /TAXON_ID=2866 /ORGANISM="Crypthecodinium cohnii, Strain Seligo" /LENGTH=139 /DNA_ID=CAMNT_0053955343 /DNA_START=100 /DNA_END=519 /DNA_ORIENTATION=+
MPSLPLNPPFPLPFPSSLASGAARFWPASASSVPFATKFVVAAAEGCQPCPRRVAAEAAQTRSILMVWSLNFRSFSTDAANVLNCRSSPPIVAKAWPADRSFEFASASSSSDSELSCSASPFASVGGCGFPSSSSLDES